jgi:hypothetical protein
MDNNSTVDGVQRTTKWVGVCEGFVFKFPEKVTSDLFLSIVPELA